MTTNSTMLSIDIAPLPKLPDVVRPGRLDSEAAKPDGVRALVGGCLLHLPRAVWMVLDMALVCGGVVLGHSLFVWWAPIPNALTDFSLWMAGVILAMAVVFAGSVFGLYEASTLWARSRIVARCLLTVTVAMAVTWLIMHLFMYSHLSRRAAATGMVFFLLTASMVRLLAHHAVRDIRRGLLVIGQGPLTGTIVRSVRRGAVPGYRLVGVVAFDRHSTQEHGESDIPVVGGLEDIEDLCREFDVAEVVVAETTARNAAHLRAAMSCLRLGCRVTDETTFYETTYGEVPVSHITPNWFLTADLKGQRKEHAVAKRVFDIVMSSIGLVLTAPLFLLVTVAIRFRSNGPVFYSQTRLGQGGRTFTLYKFRTMRNDAEGDGSETGSSAQWAQPNDPRITPIGRFLRKSRLDELPQLWNILKGEMSVVGPRPERPEFVGPLSSLIPFYDERHLIKPGLTGWAQINFSYGSSVSDARRKLQLDLYYIKHTSLELDLIILLRTFGTFFLGSR
ncbi:MAG: sugar transferase [Phycisphaerales bacterium]|nr:sugar transferase [Phycisphaerales bacterium]